MFDVIRNNPKIVQGFLAVMTVAMGSWGIDYFRSGAGKEVIAKVGSSEISSQQLDYAVRLRQEELRSQAGGDVDSRVLESPDLKADVLNKLINDEAIKVALHQARMVVPDEAVSAWIKSSPEFQENGAFSPQLYMSLVERSGKSARGFEEEQRNMLAMAGMVSPLTVSMITSRAVAQRWIALDGEERSISQVEFEGKSFTGDVKLATDAAKNYYDANKVTFRIPEQVKVEYLVLDSKTLSRDISVSDDDARKWYDTHKASMTVPEERRARHILVQVAKDAKPEERAAARKKIDDLLAQVKKDPSKFAELAKANSDDKVSAAQGGDLDYFRADAMDPAFAKAAFSLKPKEISGVVESAYGYHIIMLTDIRAAKVKTFEETRDSAIEAVRKERGDVRVTELAKPFADLVYEKRDSLKPAAEKFGLKLIQTDWIQRDALPEILGNKQVEDAIFSSDALNGHRNIAAIPVDNSTMVSARVMEYKPASFKPFEEVAAQATELAKAEEGLKLAKVKGDEVLKKLQGGTAISDLTWKSAGKVKRNDTSLDGDARKAIFSSKTDKLPAYVGYAGDHGYTIYRIDADSMPPLTEDASKIKDIQRRYSSALAEEETRQYVNGLRDILGVKISEKK